MVAQVTSPPAARGAQRRFPSPRRPRHKENRSAFWLLFPTFVLLAVIIGYPVLRALWLSLFTENADGTKTTVYVGLQNYRRALFGTASADFWKSVEVTALFAFTTVIAEIVIGTLLALIMHRRFRGRGLLRASVLVPWAIPTAVTAVLWQWMLQPAGIVNALIGHKVIWTGQVWSSRLAIIIADTWKTAPFIALLVLAGIQTISDDVYEAAKVDGANAWQRFWQITLPLIKPALAVAVLFRVLDALRMYDLPAILTGGANGTTTISLFAYQAAISQTKFGYGSALSTLTFAIVFVVGLGFVRFLGSRVTATAGPEADQ
jgi:multiple sugar transport system permease protein